MQTEISVAKSLFLGNIVEENLFPFPSIAAAEAETLRMVLDSIDKFMAEHEHEYREHDVNGAQPEAYIQSLRDMGLFGLIIPEEYGGIGFSTAAYSRVLQQTSRLDPSTSLTIGAHSSIGMKGLLLFGTPEQKKKYLPLLASGEMIAAFCLTEPGAGSDAASIKTNARVNADGSWTLNGEKIWITNGAFAGYFTVFARTEVGAGKMTAFIVERGMAGVSTGPKEDKMGIRASATTTVRFDNVQVPAVNVLGEVGKGFAVAMAILNSGRTGLGGGCVGAMKESIRRAVRQSAERKQFGRSIAEFGLVKEKIGQMTIDTFASESVVSMVSHLIDSGCTDYSVEAAISKIFATERLWSVADEALQIAGGNGFMREYPYERVIRDSRINRIFEGTNEILRLYVALSGMKDAGGYLKDLAKKLSGIFNDPIKGFGVFSGYAQKKFAQLTNVGRDRLEHVPAPLANEARTLEVYTTRLSAATEAMLRRHGKDIIEKQFAMKRCAEVAIDLFVALCVYSRVCSMLAARGEAACAQELAICRTFVAQAKRRMAGHFRRMEKNEDEEIKALADFVSANGGYLWDTF